MRYSSSELYEDRPWNLGNHGAFALARISNASLPDAAAAARLRHKDEILVLKRGSLYHAIGRLVRTELIRAKDISRNGRRPERTTYAITPPAAKSSSALFATS